MLGLHKSHQNAHYQYQKKDISIDKYDSDSDEEDQRREQAEIKGIITKARIKHSSKFKHRNLHTSANASHSAIKAKIEALHSPNHDLSGKFGDSRGFFPGTTSFVEPTPKRDFAEEMRKLSQPKPKFEEKSPNKPKGTRTLLDMDKATTVLQKSEKHIEDRISGSKKRLPELLTSSKDLEFQKQSFNSLLSFYAKSTSNQPLKLVLNRPNMSGKGIYLPKGGMDTRKEPVDASLNISHIGNNEVSEGNMQREVDGVEVKDFQELIPELIKAAGVNSCEPLDKRSPHEVPRLKNLDWGAMMKKVGSNKLELLIVDPINFMVEDCLEINSEDPKQVKEIINDAVKEMAPGMNEAKLILVFYYDKDNQKKLLFSKFFFFLKNHRYYMKGLRNEKDVATHYLFILALLDFRATYETNPFKDDKVETSKKKAFSMFKNVEPFTSFVSEWLALKIQPIIAIEKVYINMNVGGKADSNFTFNMHEHLCHAYPKLTQIIHTTLKTNSSQKSISALDNKTVGSDVFSPRETTDGKDAIVQLSRNLDKDARISYRGEKPYYSAATALGKKSDSMMYIADVAEQSKKNEASGIGTRPNYMAQLATQLPKTTAASPSHGNKAGAMSYGMVKEVYGPNAGSGSLGALGHRSMSVATSLLISTTPRINKAENKIYLSNQRMNTSYGQLLRQRFGKKSG